MGVRGLMTFVENNEELFATLVIMSNIRLVIDAFNLLMRLVGVNEGLVGYAKSVREFFDNLSKCNIKPILIFGGPIVSNSVLLESVRSNDLFSYNKGLRWFNDAKDASKMNVDFIPASTARIIFKNVAAELGIEAIHTLYQSHDLIAKTANELDCPALAVGSDFIIYKLKRGFVDIHSFAYEDPLPRSEPDEPAYSIRCSLINHARLAENLPGISSDIMPVLSIMLDENYRAAKTLDQLRWSICDGRYYGGNLFVAEKFHQKRFANLFTWMQGRDSLKEATDHILDSVDKVHRPKIEELISVCLRKYNLELVDDFGKRLEQMYPNDNVDPKLIELGQTPAQFLKRLLDQDELTSIAAHILFRNTYHNVAVPDDHSQESARCVEFRPYSLALVLLRRQALANLEPYQRLIETSGNLFFTYERHQGEYTKKYIKYMKHLENFGPLDHLDCYSMIPMEPELKKKMLLACFHSDEYRPSQIEETVARVLAGPYVQEAALCFMLVNYIAVETKQAPKREFLDALMLTIFYYAALNGHINKDSISDESPVNRMLLELAPHCKSDETVYANKEQPIEWRIWHGMSQLNCAYRAYHLVNPLLNHAFHSPRLERFYNPTLVFRLTKMFHMGELTLQDLCADLPTLTDACHAIQAQVHC